MSKIKVVLLILFGAVLLVGFLSLVAPFKSNFKTFEDLAIISDKSDNLCRTLVVFDKETNKEYLVIDKSKLKAVTQRLDTDNTVMMYKSSTTTLDRKTVSLDPVSDHEIGNNIYEYIVRDSETSKLYRIVSAENRLSIEPSLQLNDEVSVSKVIN